MDPDSESNLISIDTENKLRKFVSELICPLLVKVSEHELNIKELQIDVRRSKLDLGILENEFQRKTSKMVLIDDFNKKFDSLSTQSKTRLDELTFALNSNNLKLESQDVIISDLKSKLNSVTDNHSFVMQTLENNFKSIQDFKIMISKLAEKSYSEMNSFISNQELVNTGVSEKINKLSLRISEINSKGLPHLNNLIDERNIELSLIKDRVSELFEDRVIFNDLVKIRNKFEGDLEKISIEVADDLENITNFLDRMLRVEISCGVSDTLLKVLDARQIKKLIPVVETQLREEPYITVDNRRLSLGDLKTIQSQVLYNKTRVTTKTLESSLEGYKKKILQQEEEQKKFLDVKSAKPVKVEEKKIKAKTKIAKVVEIKGSFEKDEIKVEENYRLSSRQSSKEIDDSMCKSSVRSLDIHGYQEQIDKLADKIKGFESSVSTKLDTFKADLYPPITQLQSSLELAKKEFRTSQIIFSEEITHILKLRSKEITELTCKQDSLSKFLNSLSEDFKLQEVELSNIKKAITKSTKCLQVIQNLMNQDEQDRETLHLAGFTEKKDQKSPQKPKLSASFKPDCLSCSGNTHTLLSAYKLACLNYYPSEVTHNNESYSRPSLISHLSTLINHIWDQAEVVTPKSSIDHISRAKSTGKVKINRHILDASLTKSSFNDSPKKLDLKIKKFNFH